MENEVNRNRDSIEKVLADFGARKDMLETLCDRTKGLLEDCLQDAKLQYQSIQKRVKKPEKLEAKYLDPSKHYCCLDDITDQAALRVITYFEDEVDQVFELIKKEFNVIPEMTVDKRKSEPDRFGYHALNIVCTYADYRKTDVQFKKYAGLKFEIQVTSVLRHAWSEIEHGWYDLKDSYPDETKRRFNVLAALLELAEAEFLRLRKQKEDYKRSVDVRVEAEVTNIAIDAVSLRKLISSDTFVQSLDQKMAKILERDTIEEVNSLIDNRVLVVTEAGFTTLESISKSLKQYEAAVLEYLSRCSKELWQTTSQSRPHPRPYPKGTCIHHLSIMLIAAHGPDELCQILKKLKFIDISDEEIKKQAEIAQAAISKFKK